MVQERDTAILQIQIFEHQQRIRREFPIVKQISQSLIQIVPYKSEKPIAQGTGIAIEGNYLITALHVIEDADAIVLYPALQENSFSTVFDSGEILVDESLDVAVFLLPDVFQEIIPLRKCSSVHSQDATVLLAGFSTINDDLQWPLYKRQPTFHSGIIKERKDAEIIVWSPDSGFWELLKGLSGGAVFNREGEVVGIVKRSAHVPQVSTNNILATDIGFVTSNLRNE